MNRKSFLFVMKFILLLPLLIWFGCSSTTKEGGLESYDLEMTLEDKAGKFLMKRETGLSKNKKRVVTKYRVYSIEDEGNKILEQAINFATPGLFKKKYRLLRPDKSQYKVWFDGKLYQTETQVDPSTKSLIVKMKSPEAQWSGTKTFPFPGGTGVFCYFSQLVECIEFTGFIEKAMKHKAGKMNFHIIWDGFPYIQEQYLNLNEEPFAAAVLEYDGRTKDGESRFSLSVSGNSIFFLFSDKYAYAKVFWPAQGYSLYHK